MQPLFTPLLATLRMSRPSTAYNIRTDDGQRAYLTEASALAVAAGWNFSLADSIVAMASTAARSLPNGPAFCATPGGGFVASGRTFENAATSGYDFTHWCGGDARSRVAAPHNRCSPPQHHVHAQRPCGSRLPL